MTLINLHGVLAYEFGGSFVMNCERPKQAIEAIDANKPSFRKRMLELSQQGIHYAILVDGENISSPEQLEIKKENSIVDITPVISGSGGVALVTAIGLSIGGAVGGFLVATAGVIGGVLNMVAMTLIQKALTPSDKPQRTEATVSGVKDSFILSSKANLTEQGNPVPIGYGRLRVGSNVIQSTVKTYPQKYETYKSLFKNETTQDASLRQI